MRPRANGARNSAGTSIAPSVRYCPYAVCPTERAEIGLHEVAVLRFEVDGALSANQAAIGRGNPTMYAISFDHSMESVVWLALGQRHSPSGFRRVYAIPRCDVAARATRPSVAAVSPLDQFFPTRVSTHERAAKSCRTNVRCLSSKMTTSCHRRGAVLTYQSSMFQKRSRGSVSGAIRRPCTDRLCA